MVGTEGESRVASVSIATAHLLPSTKASTVVAVIVVFGFKVTTLPDDSLSGRIFKKEVFKNNIVISLIN